MLAKKQLFKKIRAEQALKDKEQVVSYTSNNLAEQIERLSDNQVLVVNTNIVPLKYYPVENNSYVKYKRTAAARKFLNHGAEVKPKRQSTLEDMIAAKKVPVQLREEAFNNNLGQYYACYSVMPLGKDRRKRKVTLNQCVEGTVLYGYSKNSIAQISIKNYGTLEKAKNVEFEGSTFVVEVPSRTPKKEKYKIKLTSVPTVDSEFKYAISNNFGSNHSCDFLTYKIGYKFVNDKEDSNVLNFCAHEVAAYLAIIDDAWNKDKNIIPLQMCPFAIPTQKTIDFYKKAKSKVVVQYINEKGKKTIAPLNQAEREIALWSLVKKYGHDTTFFAREKVSNYKF